MSKKAEICIAGSLCVAAVMYWVTFMGAPTLCSSAAAQSAETSEPIDQDTLDEMMHYFSPGTELDPSQHPSPPFPPMASILEEDSVEVVMEFDVTSGKVTRGLTLIAAARLAKAETDADVLVIAEKIYNGGVVTADGKGYLLPRHFPAYFNANYPKPAPSDAKPVRE